MGVEILTVTSAAGDLTEIVRHKPVQTVAIIRRARITPRLSGRLRQGSAMRLDFPNGFNDVIHVPAIGQEQILE